jgi:hypothetical protein
MGGISSIVGTLTGGLLSKPKVKPNAPVLAQKTDIDPNRGKGISAAKKAAMAARGQAGRSDLRIDLDGTATDETPGGRHGLRIA